MIQRKAHNRHAPIPTNDTQAPKPKKSYTVKHVEAQPLRLSSYWMEMYDWTTRHLK